MVVQLSWESARLKHARRWIETTHDHQGHVAQRQCAGTTRRRSGSRKHPESTVTQWPEVSR